MRQARAVRRLMLIAGLALGWAALARCGGSDDLDAAAREPADVEGSADSMRQAVAAESVASALDQWNTAEAVKRLTEAGLVVSASRRKVRRPFVSIEGDLLQVSGSTLELFVYESASARQRDVAGLDERTDTVPGALRSLTQRPRLIIVNNLVAVHTTPSERLAERVRNAITGRHAGG